MARPAVLLIDPVPERLEELSHGLAADGYEAVPVSDLALGRRFAQGLDEALIVTTTRVVAESPDPEALIEVLEQWRDELLDQWSADIGVAFIDEAARRRVAS